MSLVISVPVAVDAADRVRGLREASPYPEIIVLLSVS